MKPGVPLRGAALCAAWLAAGTAGAEPVEDFYRGKTLRLLIGYGPGGGYDIYVWRWKGVRWILSAPTASLAFS